MEHSELSSTTVTLARAFHHDPVFDFLIPNLIQQARAALTFMGTVVLDGMPFHEVWVAREGELVLGAAVWLPPGAYPRGARRDVISLFHDLGSVHRLGSRAFAGVRLYGAIDRAHRRVEEPHWYLALLGTDPGWQRRGVGSALVTTVIERADQDQTLAYLETQKPENIPWYRRHGFEVVDELHPQGCPIMWTMRREPR
ncbi:MAG: GNAT family N-acetyltransferase [Acidimicrobiales bacterium]